MAASTIAQPYQISLVNNDLTTDETLLDVFHSLDHLSAIVNEIFNKIDTRIDAEKTRISYIKARVGVCQQKVQQIKGTSQAITIFSTAKYPAPKELPLYPTLLQESSITHPVYRDAGDDATYLPADSSASLLTHPELQTEVLTIYTRLNSHGRDLERVEFTMEDEGLGPIPVHVTSISSVLLFNSSVNVYKNYQTLDNLEFTGREKVMKDEASKQLASAPATLVSGDALPDIQGLDLTFKPTMGEMSSLALPENLPLDFLANNIQFTGVDLPSIAPSAYGKANYSLPQITDGGYSSGPTAKQSSAPVAASSSSASGPPPPPPPTGGASAAASGPPPPPPPASSSGPPPPPPSSTTTSMPPPPPPMPAAESAPPMPPAAAAAAAGAGSEGGDTAGADGEGGNLPKPDARRASLLDSIKGMGMNKLKKRDDSSNAEAERRPARKEPPKAMSMQDALRERLARRNDAISGKSDRDSKHRDSVIIREAAKNAPANNPAPPASAPKKAAGLASLGFASVDDTKGNSDNESTMLPKMPAKQPPPKRGNNSDSDSDSDMSIESRAPPAKSAPVIPPPAPKIIAPPTLPPPKPAAKPAGDDQAVFASLLARAGTIGKKKGGDDSDSDDDDGEDWD